MNQSQKHAHDLTEPEHEDNTNVQTDRKLEQAGGNTKEHKKQKDKKEKNDKATTDLVNYKGIYFGDDSEKFHDDETGAHFKYLDICERLVRAARQRKVIDQKLNINYEECKVQSNVSSSYEPGEGEQFRDQESSEGYDDIKSGSSPPSSQSGSQSGNISDRYLDETDEKKPSPIKLAAMHMRT